jgi:lysocardiolipin and lysophospholipid acyltransferase
MGFVRPPAQGLLCVLTLVLVSVPLNVVQLLGYFLLPRRLGRQLSAFCFTFPAAVMAAFADNGNLEVVMYGDKIPDNESALIISNHLGAELVHFFQLAYRRRMLHAVRFVQKDVLKWIPINWTCWLHEHIFIKRDTAKSRKDSAKQMRETLCSFAEDRIPVWMVVFPEGTWVEGPREQFIVDRAHAFAKKNGLPLMKNVLTPRTAGFCAMIDGASVAVRLLLLLLLLLSPCLLLLLLLLPAAPPAPERAQSLTQICASVRRLRRPTIPSGRSTT